jgi:Conserved protein/domain typically associated with flavoprotein oxygenases, DIM6/NTAB family
VVPGPNFFEEIQAEANTGQNIGENRNQANRSVIQEALFKIPCGLFIVASVQGQNYNGMVNNTVFQITDHPLQLLVGMDKRHLTTEFIKNSGVFSVNFLQPEQIALVKIFGFKSGREINKFEDIAWRAGITGAPILKGIPGFLECKVREKTIDAGTHLVFLAEVVEAEFNQMQTVLTYQEYRTRKKELWG